ncbi:hypothetical protein GCM10009641_17510 [Mycobacterium cookii]|uniref:Uncharacterized protein n=1 Tax=Mycobacterium cookii TaxID=1775 RepID=A0A7I7L0G3_9MYCO|nr:hypothetical protein [Mycobacterium cookii]MCV7330263.1 hypothetical protein [Mycobacterium cookii]BBX47554.1 hypothetical protein MCOO_35690 [Mycobacterium cookii]
MSRELVLIRSPKVCRRLESTKADAKQNTPQQRVLIGGALLGIVGALVAIPIAAALLLLTQEVLYPRLDEV